MYSLVVIVCFNLCNYEWGHYGKLALTHYCQTFLNNVCAFRNQTNRITVPNKVKWKQPIVQPLSSCDCFLYYNYTLEMAYPAINYIQNAFRWQQTAQEVKRFHANCHISRHKHKFHCYVNIKILLMWHREGIVIWNLLQ